MGRVGAGHLSWHPPPAKCAAWVAEMAQLGVINVFSYKKKRIKKKFRVSLIKLVTVQTP